MQEPGLRRLREGARLGLFKNKVGLGVVHRRPDGSGCQRGVGASRGAKQTGPGPGRLPQCSIQCSTGVVGLGG
jgi:hypothetical protein